MFMQERRRTDTSLSLTQGMVSLWKESFSIFCHDNFCFFVLFFLPLFCYTVPRIIQKREKLCIFFFLWFIHYWSTQGKEPKTKNKQLLNFCEKQSVGLCSSLKKRERQRDRGPFPPPFYSVSLIYTIFKLVDVLSCYLCLVVGVYYMVIWTQCGRMES